LPASMWAMIPMLRVRASGNSRIGRGSAIRVHFDERNYQR
jgi:hypothetical protein